MNSSRILLMSSPGAMNEACIMESIWAFVTTYSMTLNCCPASRRRRHAVKRVHDQTSIFQSLAVKPTPRNTVFEWPIARDAYRVSFCRVFLCAPWICFKALWICSRGDRICSCAARMSACAARIASRSTGICFSAARIRSSAA